MALDNKGGPPDLDEMFRNFKNTMLRSFGGNPGPQTSGFNPLWIIGGVVVALWLASGFYIVDARESAIVMRFGAVVGEAGPGPRWHLPYPIERVEIVNLSQVRNIDVGTQPAEALMLTGDENIVDMRFSVQYHITDPMAFVFNNRSESPDATDIVQQVAETSMRGIVGNNNIDSVLNEGRDKIAADAKASMQRLLDRYKAGITIDRVNLRNIQPPEQVQAAFDDVVKAGQDRERLKSEGEAYSNDILPKAGGTAIRLKEESQAYTASVVSRANGDAKRFNQIVSEYQKAPQVTRDRLYLDAMQQILTSTTKIVADNKNGQMLYLPLDKMISANSDGAAPAASTNRTPSEPSLPAAAMASDPRNRDRESR